MNIRTMLAGLLAALMLVAATPVRAGDASQAELEKLKKEIDAIRKQMNSGAPAVRSSVDKAVDSKYGPNSSVTTKTGKLNISGLIQVWYYSIQNDNQGLFDDPTVNGIPDTNEHQDNDSFRIRRTELKFTVDIHENITGVVMIDPAREATSFPNITQNQGLFKRRANIAPEFEAANDPGGSTSAVAGVQAGGGGANRMLQDAYINYHGVIPHHDFTIGQYKPYFGEEGIRSSGQLDFVERSFLGQIGDKRDLGATVHGTWWDDRFQYWAGLFNGAGNLRGSGGDFQNRSDDNDEKDIVIRTLVRPVWKQETWGSLEIGYSFRGGTHGESSAHDPDADNGTPINGLNRNQNWSMAHNAWISYAPGGPVKGWWLRGEWLWIKDRNAPGQVIDVLGASSGDDGFAQTTGRPFSSSGFYAATGYKLSESVFADSAPGWLKPWEFAFRYDQFQNVEVTDLVNTNHTDDFTTRVWTVGVNYYIKGHNAKIQANYNFVDNPDGDANGDNRKFHNVRNDSFVVNFQVAF